MAPRAREPWEERGSIFKVALLDALAIAIVVGAKLVAAGVVAGLGWAVVTLATGDFPES